MDIFARRCAAAFAVLGVITATPCALAQSIDPPADGPTLRSGLDDATARLDQLHDQLRRLHVWVRAAEAQLPPPRADVEVVDALSSEFVVTSLRVWLDDVPLYARDDEAGDILAGTFHTLSGPLKPGQHVARIAVKLRGNGALFPYLRAYRFELASSRTFTASAGHTATISVRAFPRNSEATQYVQFPALEWAARTPGA